MQGVDVWTRLLGYETFAIQMAVLQYTADKNNPDHVWSDQTRVIHTNRSYILAKSCYLLKNFKTYIIFSKFKVSNVNVLMLRA